MKNKTTKKTKIKEIDILRTLINLYEQQENIRITAKIKNINSDEIYLYKNEQISKAK